MTRKYSAPTAEWIPASKQRFVPGNGTYPKGFVVLGIHAGVKPSNTSKPDLAILVSQSPCSAAVVFTPKEFPAAPVAISRQTLQVISGKDVQAIVVNADYASAATGKGGFEAAAAIKIGCGGLYGWVTNSEDRILNPLAHSHLSSDHASNTIERPLYGRPDRCGGSQTALTHSMARSLHYISVDGDTSINDTVTLLAKGATGLPTIAAGKSTAEDQDYHTFQSILTSLVAHLAKLVVWEGEGATRFLTIRIMAAPSRVAAHAIASSIARSPLVKTALYGKDANWGRIMCAMGNTPSLPPGTIMPEQTSLSFVPPDGTPELKRFVNGEPETLDEERGKEILDQDQLEILVRSRRGDNGGEEACLYTCDLGHGYVTINGHYRS
ncbi:MAG: hypothetical protein M1825_001415 [Sarcosagium campestre]|nr:MAG: hypothetical protein M1825_001415 [Sarcosagium campestre]